MKCQCEHSSHFDEVMGDGIFGDENFGHGCQGVANQTVKTDYGTFQVCKACYLEKHMAPYYEGKNHE